MPLDPQNCPLFSPAEHCNGINGNTNNISKQELALDIRVLHDTLIRFKSILVDPAEFACLKAIVLFRSETRGLKDPAPIENLQDQAQVIEQILSCFSLNVQCHFYFPYFIYVNNIKSIFLPGSIISFLDNTFIVFLSFIFFSFRSGNAVGTLSSSISNAKCTVRTFVVDVTVTPYSQFTSYRIDLFSKNNW